MNKTFTINLGGSIFHIDDVAYDQLKQYLAKLNVRFGNMKGKDEVLTDIESRMGEMLQTKITPIKSSLSLEDVNWVIGIMGNPEDISDGSEESNTSHAETISASGTTNNYSSGKKRFFRNPDDKILGGVCGGVAAYFNFDPLWLRLAFVLLFITGGAGVLLYLVLWIIIPEAKTGTEKLEMRGEKINLENIQRNIQEEMKGVGERVSQIGQEISSPETRKNARTGFEKFMGFLGDIFKAIFKLIAGFLGLILALCSIGALVTIAIALFSFIGWVPLFHGVRLLHYFTQPWVAGWLVFGAVIVLAVPLLLLFLNGIKLLFKINLNLKRIGFVMLIIWLIGIAAVVITGLTISSEYSNSATLRHTETLNVKTPVLVIKSSNTYHNRFDNHWEFGWGDRDDDNLNNITPGLMDTLLGHHVEFNIERSTDDSVRLTESIYSRGSTYSDALDLAKSIQYNYSLKDSTLLLQDVFSLQQKMWRGQRVRLILELPMNKKVRLDKSLTDIIEHIPNVQDIYDSENLVDHQWEMTNEGLKCLDCPENNSDKDNDSSSIKAPPTPPKPQAPSVKTIF
jgi:phage shock protein PspC (stress-responsive transcriptional regulator)